LEYTQSSVFSDKHDYLAISAKYDKLITALRTAQANDLLW